VEDASAYTGKAFRRIIIVTQRAATAVKAGARQRPRHRALPNAEPAAEGHLVVITGLSGSGKGSVLKVFEDSGYYCVDNLPVDLLPKFAALIQPPAEITRAALVIDIREGQRLETLPDQLQRLRKGKLRVTLLFLEASDQSLLRRFSETRRPHPLGAKASSLQGIAAERRVLARIREAADLVVDTSRFNVHELRAYVTDKVVHPDSSHALGVAVTSFGYRHGVPPDADLVFDVRFLPNPHFVPEFRHRTGRDPQVAKYIRSFPQSREFLARVTELLHFLIPHYIGEGKSYLTIAIGCTGGQHRSVMMAEEIRKALKKDGFDARLTHRDMPRH